MSSNSNNFKICLVGDTNVGKTAILAQYADHIYSEEYLSTIGIDLKVRFFEHKNLKYKLTMWDTAGQEKYDCITRSYLRQSQIGILVFSLNDESSFDNILRWYNKMALEHQEDPHIKYVLVGNKSDQKDGSIKMEMITNLIKKLESEINQKLSYFEVSAKDNFQINELFEHIKSLCLIKPIIKEAPVVENVTTTTGCCRIL